MALNAGTLSSLPSVIQRPAYDWQKVPVGIVHVSLGAFHRSHQAVYTDDTLAQKPGSWGICGVGALPSDKNLIDGLQAQNTLYSVAMKGPKTTDVRIVGSLREAMLMPGNVQAVLKRLEDPAVKILSLTITEKGYCHNPQTGKLNEKNPAIVHDLANPNEPQSVIGLIVAALRWRQQQGAAPFTVLSCDNLPGNGHKTADIVTALARLQDEKLANWIEANVAFPNTMVDRITPVTTAADKVSLTERFGYTDEALVVCEPFCQWILEDKFTLGRPAWENVGAQFVGDVYPYELAKIRLLNVIHTVLAYPAFLMGFVHVHEGASDALLARYARKVMDDEITSTLPPVPGLDLEPYKTTILERFANPAILDTWERICSDGSSKIANQLVPIVYERLTKGQDVKGLALLVAAWFRYLTGVQDDKSTYTLNDPLAARLQKLAKDSGTDAKPLLAVKEVFGEQVMEKTAFVNHVCAFLPMIYEKGIRKVIEIEYS
ncbi:MAG: mannitol dehydrogenase family protein [Alphaproteobacteria bacterium]|nr:mannitol dehydrogenase family protein [Alphaproteobacteria bacterium]